MMASASATMRMTISWQVGMSVMRPWTVPTVHWPASMSPFSNTVRPRLPATRCSHVLEIAAPVEDLDGFEGDRVLAHPHRIAQRPEVQDGVELGVLHDGPLDPVADGS